jgi:nitrate reductase NapD
MKSSLLNNAATEQRPSNAGSYSVCGLVVHCPHDQAAKVSVELEKIAGVEVHGGEGGKLVVTVEELPGEKKLIDRVTEINNTSGVLSASLVYTESSDDADGDLEE